MTIDWVRIRSAIAWAGMIATIGFCVPLMSEHRVIEVPLIAVDFLVCFAFAYAARPWREDYRQRVLELPARMRARFGR